MVTTQMLLGGSSAQQMMYGTTAKHAAHRLLPRVGICGGTQLDKFHSICRAYRSMVTRAAQIAEQSVQNDTHQAKPKATSQAGHGVRVISSPITDVDLPLLPENINRDFDLAIAGAGPAGLAVAARVSAAGFQACIIDPDPLAAWPNNYGVWVDEFEAMGLDDCLEVTWPQARVYLDSGPDDEKFLRRPYGRVDRDKLKRTLLQRCIDSGVLFHLDRVSGATHSGPTSKLQCAGGKMLPAAAILDATGHALRLVEFDHKFDPGYQGAYGIMCEVESHPFELDTMLFMDWRDEHTDGYPEMKAANQKLPTFLYAMPFSETTIFLEETSLVAKPAVPFPELEARLKRRMEHMGIVVTKLHEDERCLIPMGGVLPRHPQRTLGIGGTAGMVHPSTGYMVARMLGTAPSVADAIIEQLCAPFDADSKSRVRQPDYTRTVEDADAMSKAVWNVVWPRERLQQRAFFTFGQKILLELNLQETRDFFRSFFSLSAYQWQGFLSARLSFFELIAFGLSLFINAGNSARLNLLRMGVPGLIAMLVELARIGL